MSESEYYLTYVDNISYINTPKTMTGAKVVVITGRYWDPKAKVYGINEDPREYNYIGTSSNHSIPPYLLCDNEEHTPLFDVENPLSAGNQEKSMTTLFGTHKLEEAILFVHGFNNELSDAKRRANIILDITKKTVIVFDWPSSHNSFLIGTATGYARDSEMATASVRALNWVLYLLLDNINKIHIFSHSMGSRIAVASLGSLTHDYSLLNIDKTGEVYNTYQNRLGKLGKLVFKEPDIDKINMAKFISRFIPTLKDINTNIKVYIFAHNDDKALKLSQSIHGDYRVGQLKGARDLEQILIRAPNVKEKEIPLDIIDESSCGDTVWIIHRFLRPYGNHSYFDCPKFQKDLMGVLK